MKTSVLVCVAGAVGASAFQPCTAAPRVFGEHPLSHAACDWHVVRFSDKLSRLRGTRAKRNCVGEKRGEEWKSKRKEEKQVRCRG